jgi:hypothetical protein
MMACSDDQVGIEFTGRQRDFLGWFASDKFLCARRIGLLERLSQVSQPVARPADFSQQSFAPGDTSSSKPTQGIQLTIAV